MAVIELEETGGLVVRGSLFPDKAGADPILHDVTLPQETPDLLPGDYIFIYDVFAKCGATVTVTETDYSKPKEIGSNKTEVPGQGGTALVDDQELDFSVAADLTAKQLKNFKGSFSLQKAKGNRK